MVKKYFIKSILLTAMILCMTGSEILAGGAGTSNAEFLRIGPGARPAAMAGAYTAIANDINAGFWNPAGLANLNGRGFTFMHLSWFESLNYEYLAYGEKLSRNEGVGVHLIYFWVPDFNSTIDEAGIVYDPQAGKMADFLIGLSYGYDLDYVPFFRGTGSFGVTVKAISRTLMDQNKLSFVADAGLMVNSDLGIVIAGKIENLGTDIDGDQSPLTLKLGIGYPLDFQGGLNNLRIACDLVKPIDIANINDQRFETAIGAEYILFEMLALRAGYKVGEDLAGFTAGVGGRYEFFQIDYAFAPYGELGYTHRFSVTLDFPTLSSQQAVIEKKQKDQERKKEFAPMMFKLDY